MNWDSLDNSGKYTLTDARRLWMVWWNRNTPNFLHLKAKHHAEGQRAFQWLLAEARSELRTDEAVERVAQGIHDADCACGDLTNPKFEGWEGSEYYRDLARAAITALIGEEP